MPIHGTLLFIIWRAPYGGGGVVNETPAKETVYRRVSGEQYTSVVVGKYYELTDSPFSFFKREYPPKTSTLGTYSYYNVSGTFLIFTTGFFHSKREDISFTRNKP